MVDWPESVILQINRRAKSISLKLVLFTTAFFGVTSASSLIYFFQKRLEVTVTNSLVALQQSIALGDIYQIKKLSDSLVSGGSVAGIWISEKSGEIIVEKINDSLEGLLEKPAKRGFFFSNGQILASHHATILDTNGKSLGQVIVADPFPVSQFILSLLVLALILIFGAIYLIYSFKNFGAYISRPLLDFCEQLSYVDQYNKGVTVDKPFREIALLETEFNNLLVRTKNSEQKEREAEKQAAIGRIISQLSHDMRAPLGIFESLIFARPDSSLASHLPTIKTSVRRLHSMIESLRHVDLESLIVRTTSKLDLIVISDHFESLATSRGIKVNVSVSAQINNVYADHPKLERAWINLITNAIQFARSYVSLEFFVADSDLVIRIVDDGPGVSSEFLPKLFERGATFGKHDGTGLGLAYVRQIMRGHGGDVVYLREKELTIFECRLPNAVEPEKEISLESQAKIPMTTKNRATKRVAICFKPEVLNRSIVQVLNSHKSENFHFSSEVLDAEIVATNDPEIALCAIEEGKEPLEFSPSLQESAIMDRLVRRFHLVSK